MNPPQPNPIRILIADDHPVIRTAMRQFLDAQDDMTVIGMASNGAEAVRMAQDLCPDVVLMDFAMPAKGGAAATKEIRAADSRIVVIGYSMQEDETVTKAMLEADAVAQVSKHHDNEVLLEAIRKHAFRDPK